MYASQIRLDHKLFVTRIDLVSENERTQLLVDIPYPTWSRRAAATFFVRFAELWRILLRFILTNRCADRQGEWLQTTLWLLLCWLRKETSPRVR